MSTAIVPTSFFSDDQEKMIRDSFLNGASPQEAAVLLELARARRLNPITRQIHFVKRWDGQKKREVWAAQVGIDGFRAIAERTGKYGGQDEPEFEYEKDGSIKLCRVKIYRKDWERPAVGIAHFKEYAQTTKEGGFTSMWKNKPHVMIAKCAEAVGHRKAFPEDMSGLYTPEEMGAEPEEKDITPEGFGPVQIPAETATRPQTIEAPVQTATERAKALIKEKIGFKEEKASQTPWGQITEAAKAVGIVSDRLKAITKDATGKGAPKDLTAEDAVLVIERIKALEVREPGAEG